MIDYVGIKDLYFHVHWSHNLLWWHFLPCFVKLRGEKPIVWGIKDYAPTMDKI